MWWTLLDRYLWREWIKVLALTLAATGGLLLLMALYDDLPEFLQAHTPTVEIVRYFVVLLPTFLPTLLPLSLLVATLLTLGRLQRGHEIVAMRAGGLSIWRLGRSIWVGGALGAVLLFFLQADWVPRATEEARRLLLVARLAQHERTAPGAAANEVRALSLANARDHRLWVVNRFSESLLRGTGLTVYQRDAAGHLVRTVSASVVSWAPDTGWELRAGRDTEFDPATGEAIRSRTFDLRPFPEWTEEPWLLLALRQKARDLSLHQIQAVLDRLEPDDPRRSAFAVQWHRLWTAPLLALVAVGLALPFAARGLRRQAALGTARAVGWFFGFYVLGLAFAVLGESGSLAPALAAWLPTVLALGFTAWQQQG